MIIAKLAGLVDLNRFDVSAIERQSAEVRFLDKYFSAEDSLKADHIRDIERLKKVTVECWQRFSNFDMVVFRCMV